MKNNFSTPSLKHTREGEGIKTRDLIFLLMIWLGAFLPDSTLWANNISSFSPREMTGPLLTLDSIYKDLEKSHPLLKRTRAKKIIASGKLLKALGKFEPKLVNDWELERLVKDGKTVSVGFNDTFMEIQHPWGIKGFAGFRAGIGNVEVADLGINTTNQPLLGIVIPLLRGFIDNPANAELKKSYLADQQAQVEIQQTRQDLYLGAATQYWNWVAASKIRDIQNKAMNVARERVAQLIKQIKSGARARIDVIEARQELQNRKDLLVKANRNVEQEQYKLALFLWNQEDLVVPENRKAPDFPPTQPEIPQTIFNRDQKEAVARRPEIQQIYIQAKFNQIDLELAENKKLPSLELKAEPTRKPGEFVLGLGYHFGAQLTFPFLQREARGEILQTQGEAERLRLLKLYRAKKIGMDVANARSAINRSRERVGVLKHALEFARQMEKGEHTLFKLGASSLLVVNVREQNTLKANEEWIKAMANYHKSLALYQWATGKWVKTIKLEDDPNIKVK
jgi:outer membrane protein TolC